MRVQVYKCDVPGCLSSSLAWEGMSFNIPNGKEADPSGNGYNQAYLTPDICKNCLQDIVSQAQRRGLLPWMK